MKIIQVGYQAELKKFVNFPYEFYKGDPNWIPPLRVELKNQFNPKINPLLDHCTYQRELMFGVIEDCLWKRIRPIIAEIPYESAWVGSD